MTSWINKNKFKILKIIEKRIKENLKILKIIKKRIKNNNLKVKLN